MPERLWIGSPPQACDLCREPLTDHFYDARTRRGPWACLCHACFQEQGVGLGTGCGQEYRQRADGRFVKVAG
jgi:hypothetical protein